MKQDSARQKAPIRAPRASTGVRWLADLTSLGMFVVVVMGATVTNTGSADGCGHSWPLCQGQLVPEFTVATFIEFSHRAVTGAESLLVVLLTAVCLLVYRQYREMRWLAPVMLAFLILQAVLGGLAVLYPESTAVLALHFGISLIAFASTFLIAAFFHELGWAEHVRRRPSSPLFRAGTWAVGVYVLVVVYTGAFIRHAGYSLACTGWPLCNGQVVPSLAGPTAFVFAHRLAAVGAIVLLGGLAWLGWRERATRPDLAWGSLAACGLVLIQSAVGATVVLTYLSLFSALAHAAVMELLFASVAYLCLHVLPWFGVAPAPATTDWTPVGVPAQSKT